MLEGGRVRKVRGQRAALVVACEWRGGMGDKGLEGERREREREKNVGHSKCFNRWA